MGQIVGYQTSHEAWTALEKIFSASSKVGDTTIGKLVLEKDQVLQILGGLGLITILLLLPSLQEKTAYPSTLFTTYFSHMNSV